MKDYPLITVIVPVYNVEAYLDECVQSILNQSYKNLDIILVDDGSKDGSPSMCDSWSQKDQRIRVIHKKNGGLSSARNAGLEIVKGDYISFVDSDDFFDDKMYEVLYEGISRSSDIGISTIKFYRYTDGKVEIHNVKWDSKVETLVEPTDFGVDTLLQKVCHASTNKLYRRDLLETVRFREGVLNEDVWFMYDLSKVVERLHVKMLELPYYAYYYRMRSDSICHASFPIEVSIIQNLNSIIDEEKGGRMTSAARYMRNRTIWKFCTSILIDNPQGRYGYYQEYYKSLSKELKGISYADIADPETDARFSCVLYWMVMNTPQLYRYLYKLFRIVK